MERVRALLGRVWRRQRSTCDSLRKEEEEGRDEFAQLQGMEENLPAAEKMEDKNSSWQDPVLPFVEEDSGSVLAPPELPSQDDMGAGLQSGALPKARRSLKGLRRWAWKRNQSPSSSTPCDSLRTEDKEEVRGELAQLQSMEEELPAAEAENDSSEDPEDLFTKPSVRQPRHELTRALQARYRAESLLQVPDMLGKQLQEKNLALQNQKVAWKEQRKAWKEQVMALQEENVALQKKNMELQEELQECKAKEEDHLKKCAGAKAYIEAVMQQKVSDLQQELDHALRMQRISESELRELRLLNERQHQQNIALLEEHKAVIRRIMELQEELDRL